MFAFLTGVGQKKRRLAREQTWYDGMVMEVILRRVGWSFGGGLHSMMG